MSPSPSPQVTDDDRAISFLWKQASDTIIAIDPATTNWKAQQLPLARIKKIMKSDEVVYAELEKENGTSDGSGTPTNPRFMIAGEAPILLGKACEFLVKELAIRGWRHTERNRRRTLQKQDIQSAVGESEVYDFLIDIVPRVTLHPGKAYVTESKPALEKNTEIDSSIVTQAHPPLVTSNEQSVMNTQTTDMNFAQLNQMQYNMFLQNHQMHIANGNPIPTEATSTNQPVQHPQQMMMNPAMYVQPPVQWHPQHIPMQQQSVPAQQQSLPAQQQSIPAPMNQQPDTTQTNQSSLLPNFVKEELQVQTETKDMVVQ